ncbi:MAG: hypothetical protein ABF630_09555 [Liquorilactobacillus sp.]
MKNDVINKYLSQQASNKTNLLPSVLAIIIFTKEFYDHNDKIKQFTKVYLKTEYKNYLFASRTSLYARIIKDFYINTSKIDFFKISIDLFLKDKIHIAHSKTKSSQKKIIEEWRNVINPND